MVAHPTDAPVLVLFDGRPGGLTQRLAVAIGEGVARVPGASLNLKDVDSAAKGDLLAAQAIILGCPNWSGMTAKLKGFLDSVEDLWEERLLEGKVGAAFVTGRFKTAGAEITLLGLLHWLLSHGMIIVGIPWSPRMLTAGSYYGATAAGSLTEDDAAQAQALGERVARLAIALARATS